MVEFIAHCSLLPSNVIHVALVPFLTPDVMTVRLVVILANHSLILLKDTSFEKNMFVLFAVSCPGSSIISEGMYVGSPYLLV